MDSKEMGQRIRQRRRELRLTQERLASLAGCSMPFINSVESGKQTLRLDKLLAVLEVLGLSLQVLPRDKPSQ